MRIIFIVVFSVVVVIWLFSSRPEPQAQLRELPPAQVITDTVKTINIQPVRTVTGKLQPSRRTGLTFELSGRIRRRQVEPGQYVAADTVLLQIDDGDFTDAVAETSASLQRERDAVERDRRLLALARATRVKFNGARWRVWKNWAGNHWPPSPDTIKSCNNY